MGTSPLSEIPVRQQFQVSALITFFCNNSPKSQCLEVSHPEVCLLRLWAGSTLSLIWDARATCRGRLWKLSTEGLSWASCGPVGP